LLPVGRAVPSTSLGLPNGALHTKRKGRRGKEKEEEEKKRKKKTEEKKTEEKKTEEKKTEEKKTEEKKTEEKKTEEKKTEERNQKKRNQKKRRQEYLEGVGVNDGLLLSQAFDLSYNIFELDHGHILGRNLLGVDRVHECTELSGSIRNFYVFNNVSLRIVKYYGHKLGKLFVAFA
jgi:ATPase subunit of ABC transporter with duplicated ATPase domains